MDRPWKVIVNGQFYAEKMTRKYAEETAAKYRMANAKNVVQVVYSPARKGA